LKELSKRKLAALCLIGVIAVFASCDNPALEGSPAPAVEQDDWDGEDAWDEQDGSNDDEALQIRSSIKFSEPQLVGESVAPGALVTTISFPDEEGPWTASLVNGTGGADNLLFEIKLYPEQEDGGEGEGEGNDEDEPAPYAELVIKEDGDALEWGHYSVRIKIDNGDEWGLAFYKILEFDVTLCPPLFTRAPIVYPYMINGDVNNNKMVIKWDKRATATSYSVYVWTTDDPPGTAEPDPAEAAANAVLLNPDGYGGDVDSAEMKSYPGDTDTTTGLPPGKNYWFWVTASNSSGTTPPSPIARKKTSSPVPEYFYTRYDEKNYDKIEDNDVEEPHELDPIFDCGGYGDYYRITAKTVKYWFPSGLSDLGSYDYLGDIVYHEAFDLGAGGDNGKFPNEAKDGATALGFPCGVFVLKYREGCVPPVLASRDSTKRYSAVYYWGMGTSKEGTGGSHAGRVEANIVNQWARYAETVTYEEAIDRFYANNVQTFLGLIPEPYYKQFVPEAEIKKEPFTDQDVTTAPAGVFPTE
jgi:hypothetical protein